MAQNKGKRFNLTIFIYLFIFFALVSLMLISSRKVLFRPWTARTFAASVKLGNDVFLFGGLDDEGESRDEIMMIDMEKQALYRIASLPQPVYSAAAAAHDGIIYMAGGLSDKQYQDQIYRFNPESKDLQLIGRLPGKRAFGSLSASGSHLYYIGGFDGKDRRSEIIEINPQTGDAFAKVDLPYPREYHRSITLGPVVYIIGGEDDQGQNLSSIIEYSPGDNRLTLMADLNSPIVRFAVTEIESDSAGGEVLIAGGGGPGRSSSLIQLLFQNSSYTEQFLGMVPESFLDVELISYNKFLYIIGGTEPEFKRQIRVLKIDPSTMEYEEVHLKSYAWR